MPLNLLTPTAFMEIFTGPQGRTLNSVGHRSESAYSMLMKTFSQVNETWILGWGRVHDNGYSLVGHLNPQKWLRGCNARVWFVYSVHNCRISWYTVSRDGSKQPWDSSRNKSLSYMDWFSLLMIGQYLYSKKYVYFQNEFATSFNYDISH